MDLSTFSVFSHLRVSPLGVFLRNRILSGDVLISSLRLFSVVFRNCVLLFHAFVGFWLLMCYGKAICTSKLKGREGNGNRSMSL
jgi:hypothetical protein